MRLQEYVYYIGNILKNINIRPIYHNLMFGVFTTIGENININIHYIYFSVYKTIYCVNCLVYALIKYTFIYFYKIQIYIEYIMLYISNISYFLIRRFLSILAKESIFKFLEKLFFTCVGFKENHFGKFITAITFPYIRLLLLLLLLN